MDLVKSMKRARVLLSTGDDEQAADALDAASSSVSNTDDRQVLLDYAEMCRQWADSSSEEEAIRRALVLGEDVETIRLLLDALQQRLNDLQGDAHREMARQCLELGERAIRIAGGSEDQLALAQLRYNQGLRHLDLARHGERDHASTAVSHFKGHLVWLASGDGVPPHWPLENHEAEAMVDLAEALLVMGRKERAVEALDVATSKMERATLPDWMTRRAYRLLDEAMG